eukprot:3936063-Pleurochrysis_carterae.AAC.2
MQLTQWPWPSSERTSLHSEAAQTYGRKPKNKRCVHERGRGRGGRGVGKGEERERGRGVRARV